MILRTNVLTMPDLHDAARMVNADHPGCQVYIGTRVELHDGPRTRVRRFEKVSLRSVTGTRRPNPGTAGAYEWDSSERVASWTEWGWFLAELFVRDPDLHANEYRGLEDFHEQTGYRFKDPRTPRQRQVARAVARTR